MNANVERDQAIKDLQHQAETTQELFDGLKERLEIQQVDNMRCTIAQRREITGLTQRSAMQEWDATQLAIRNGELKAEAARLISRNRELEALNIHLHHQNEVAQNHPDYYTLITGVPAIDDEMNAEAARRLAVVIAGQLGGPEVRSEVSAMPMRNAFAEIQGIKNLLLSLNIIEPEYSYEYGNAPYGEYVRAQAKN